MHTVELSKSTVPADKETFAALLWRDVNEARKYKPKIYRTHVRVPSPSSERVRFVLMTTSKELHLKLGSYEWRCHYHLAKFLEEQSGDGLLYSQFLLCLKGESESSEEGILVSRSIDEGDVVFTLTPVR